MVAKTARRKKRIQSLFRPEVSFGSARMSAAKASPWRNSSLHQSSNQSKIGWIRFSGCFSSAR